MPFQIIIRVPPLKYFELRSCVITVTGYIVIEQENLSTHSTTNARLKSKFHFSAFRNVSIVHYYFGLVSYR